MTRITRKLSFFKQNHFVIFGVLWTILAIAMFIIAIFDEDSKWFSRVLLPGLYLLSAILYFIGAIRMKGKNSEYIEWDHEKLIVKKQNEKPKGYLLSNLNNLTIATQDLIIKAPNASGTMMDLKGYSEDDIQKLRADFSNFNQSRQS